MLCCSRIHYLSLHPSGKSAFKEEKAFSVCRGLFTSRTRSVSHLPTAWHPDQFWTVSALPSLANCLDCDFGGGEIPVSSKFRRFFFSYSPDSCNYSLAKCLSESTAKKTPLNQRMCWITVCHFLSNTGDENVDSIEFPQLLSEGKKTKKKKPSLPHHQGVLGEIFKIKPDFCKGLYQYTMYQVLDPN